MAEQTLVVYEADATGWPAVAGKMEKEDKMARDRMR